MFALDQGRSAPVPPAVDVGESQSVSAEEPNRPNTQNESPSTAQGEWINVFGRTKRGDTDNKKGNTSNNTVPSPSTGPEGLGDGGGQKKRRKNRKTKQSPSTAQGEWNNVFGQTKRGDTDNKKDKKGNTSNNTAPSSSTGRELPGDGGDQKKARQNRKAKQTRRNNKNKE